MIDEKLARPQPVNILVFEYVTYFTERCQAAIGKKIYICYRRI